MTVIWLTDFQCCNNWLTWNEHVMYMYIVKWIAITEDLSVCVSGVWKKGVNGLFYFIHVLLLIYFIHVVISIKNKNQK